MRLTASYPRLIAGVFTALSIALTMKLHADEGWSSISVPGFWEKRFGGIVEEHDGYAWYRAFVEIPESWKGRPMSLELGPIDDCDETFLNGERIGASGTIQPFRTASNDSRKY